MLDQSQPVTYRPVPFNFVDLEEKANGYLENVRREAGRILAQAREEVARMSERVRQESAQSQAEAERVRKETETLDLRLEGEKKRLEELRRRIETESREKGYEEGNRLGREEGYQTGYADGELQATVDYDEKIKREASLMLGEQLETLMPALQLAVERIQTAQHAFLAHWERSAIQVAAAMAYRTINRHLPEMKDVPCTLIREALELGVGSSMLKLRLNPEDYEALLPRAEMIVNQLAGSAATEIVPDERVTPGGCILETSLGVIDQRIESRLDRIQMELV